MGLPKKVIEDYVQQFFNCDYRVKLSLSENDIPISITELDTICSNSTNAIQALREVNKKCSRNTTIL